MELKDINIQDTLMVECKILNNSKLSKGIGKIIPNDRTYIFKGVELSISDTAKKRDLDFYLSRGIAHLAEVETMYKNTIILRCCFFANEIIVLNEDTHIYINPDKIKNKKAKKDDKNLNQYFEELAKKCHLIYSYKDNKETYFILQANPDIFIPDDEINEELKQIQDENNLEITSENDDKATKKNAKLKSKIRSEMENENKQKIAFSVYGTNIRIDVEKWKTGIGFSATRFVTRKNKKQEPNYILIKGCLKFSNEKTAISDFTKKKLEEIKKQSGSYLDAWDKYANERGENLLKNARNFGTFKIENIEIVSETKDSYKLFLKEFDKQKLINHMTIDITDEEPLFLRKEDLSWSEYLNEKLIEDKDKNKILKDISKEKQDEIKKTKNCKIQTSDGNSITIECKYNLLKLKIKNLLIHFSTFGEEVQLKRQKIAREAINQGRSGIPYLSMLLEEKGQIFQYQKIENKRFKISTKTFDKIFKNPPTDTQRDAIKMALQTPDIALIQGPPGTGKTTVINAIVEELNNRYDKKNNTTGAILLSSYQHAAVENIIERVRINSLPTPKFGKKIDGEEYRGHIEKWTNELINTVRKQNPELKFSAYDLELKSAYAKYKVVPSPANKIRFLDKLLQEISLSNDLRKKIDKAREESLELSYSTDQLLLQKIRALRTNEVSFADDGKERCKDLLYDLENEENKKVLEKYAYSSELPSNNDLQALRGLKQELLHQVLPKPMYLKFEVDKNIQDLYALAQKEIKMNKSKQDKTLLTQYEYLEHLESNPMGLNTAINDCSFAISATAQQAEGGDLKKFKNPFFIDDKTLELFDTVIIDEAARATPPDLLIPMAKARKKILLVGDHRQLPHLIDEELEEKVIESEKRSSKSDDSNIKEYYNLSMFEHMFKRLKELEKSDGIRRTITLDAQYRTHPLLGKFASDNFYAKNNEAFKSPRPAEDFFHNLDQIENKACIWLDVSKNYGLESRSGTSWIRNAEIIKIVDYLEKWKKSEQGKNLSYGIITFYKAQSDKIKKEIKNRKIAEKNIKVGTVDAFQGMEFDIVFLSAVRCNKKKHYGFLTMENRLNVAVTRQKKALVFVGDSEFLTSEDARLESNIPAIGNFYDLCKENGVIL
ncbi:MAG: hypothetical protein CR982_05465 [Candidatus Cloacimonadota bacterium]|nr:MAG: hypothetical protein CR982_05465 [Candidatus Cloacimonadota bacterium]PIE77584.1 MAG: hypothetical protein CSA15_12160 [Candidatus Delongbacteria bacterium]